MSALLLALLVVVLPSTAAALFTANGAPWWVGALVGAFLYMCIGAGLRGALKSDSGSDTP